MDHRSPGRRLITGAEPGLRRFEETTGQERTSSITSSAESGDGIT
jgi:hypothetical protein